MATLWLPNTTAPITLENQWREARNIITKGEGEGEQSGQLARDWSVTIGECNKQAQQAHVGNKQALWACGAPHNVDRWPVGLEVYFAKSKFSHIKYCSMCALTMMYRSSVVGPRMRMVSSILSFDLPYFNFILPTLTVCGRTRTLLPLIT